MHDDRVLVEKRLDRVLRERIRPAVYSMTSPLQVTAWQAPGEPVPFEVAREADFVPVQPGQAWGPPWGTTWFRVTADVPPQWAGRRVEVVLDLGFAADRPGFQCEGLAYTPDGEPIKGLHPRNWWLPVTGASVDYLVEAASNPLISHTAGVTPLGDKATAGSEPLYRLGRMELAVLEPQVWELVQDLEVLDSLMRSLGLHEPRRFDILRAIESALDCLDLQNIPGTAKAARGRLAPALRKPAYPSAHKLSAIGHAHIDSAWLWPQRETIRKVARTAANVTTLMELHPDFKFAMSQAQQLAWIKEHYPHVYTRVAKHVASGQFVPVGGMWVESDTNLPGGEALARQFVHGKRFFLEEFGIDTQEVWLPDSFGYSAALPQLVLLSGSKWFLTQKISWNQTNRFPHHTFNWEGIDGSRVFTHFPPVDTYNSDLSGGELAHAAANFSDKGRASRSLVPFGWGNGGGGPTREMIARARRTADLEGSSRVAMESPQEFFSAAQEDYPQPPVWVGELYLELHRGTYTSQARTKQGNRRSEHLLREAELWAATATVNGLADYPYEQLDRLWKTVLLHQFHDILPGSSIAWVHREAESTYAGVRAELEKLIASSIGLLAGSGSTLLAFDASPRALASSLHTDPLPATPTRQGTDLVLDNGLIRAVVSEQGLVTSLVDQRTGREVLAAGHPANLLQLHPDLPNAWDAWDVDAFYRNRCTDLTMVSDLSVRDGGIVVTRRFGSSVVKQRISLAQGSTRLDFETEVDWREVESILKAAFPLAVHADRFASEIQFGHVMRPTHVNTSWEAAKFETCAHRFVHVAEPGFGVAVVNDSTYGHDVRRDGKLTTIRLSLLRAPRFPDPLTDQGVHRFRYALAPGAGIADAVAEGYRINLPPRVVFGDAACEALVRVDNPAVVVEAVKLADDRSGDVIVRLYESLGGRARATLTPSFPVDRVSIVDLLERPLSDDTGAAMEFGPFQIRTVRLHR
ncbi:alpha-mannosidase [Rhizocola hellebori]|uniref:Alpha-mannosidase n=1 Tax=Rhizocola hellebori TaxID=1392758 RepID=A0A8J3Q9Q8_9ACTN|nr:glycoside hydrolase family 38 C-terminal domain-containing protein [Rhizocola hellebori]GIH05645.1 alpha-mannosidase [Rhizocola hellebori]